MDAVIDIAVLREDFDPGALQEALPPASGGAGAVATFTGYVRGQDDRGALNWMELEHYPGMTEASLRRIADEACARWGLLAVTIVHRTGRLFPGERIVWVGTAAMHRGEAFAACEFLMDYLKTRAPLWKRESGEWGETWVEARDSDSDRAGRWQAP
ncbi:MAG: molybdenum cofactor biosynthesis protein MoaE [Pseudomonadota bacterium]